MAPRSGVRNAWTRRSALASRCSESPSRCTTRKAAARETRRPNSSPTPARRCRTARTRYASTWSAMARERPGSPRGGGGGAPRDYGGGAGAVGGAERELWRDGGRGTPGSGPELGAALVVIPPATLPVGEAELEVVWGGDTTRSPFLVSFSNQWVITNFDEMLSLLRYFSEQQWVDSLRRAAPERRSDLWRDFWRATDPVPMTPENEALDDYFHRVQLANVRFQDEGEPGWLTDRGEVFISLGEPDEMLDMSNGMDRTGARVVRWTYSSERLI